MDAWETDFEWLRIQHFLKERFNKSTLPDMNAVLFLIGMQEYGKVKRKFSKEQKQDLMHIAICSLLSPDGYYKFRGFDDQGWPHYDQLKPLKTKGVKEQESLLKEKIIEYFKDIFKP